MISSTLYFLLIQLNYHFRYPLFKVIGLHGRNPNTSAGNWFQCWMVLFTKEYFPISGPLPPTPYFPFMIYPAQVVWLL